MTVTINDTDDFFGDAATEVERNPSNGNPIIIQPDGTRLEYTRASSLGDFVTNNDFLRDWELCNLAVALGRRRDLADQCATEPYTTGFDEPDQRTKSASKKRLMGLIERLLDAVKIHERADRGTVVHAVTEQDYDGFVPISVITEHAAFNEWLAINGIIRCGSEIFVVNDELRVAGTFDHLFWHPIFGLIIGDTKNGRNSNPLGFGCQFANYSRSVVYDPATGKRTPLARWVFEQYGTLGGKIDVTTEVNQDFALLLSVKAAVDGGVGEVKVSEVDINWGYEACKVAAQVRDLQRDTASRVLQSKRLKHVKGKAAKELALAAIQGRIETAPTSGELRAIWKQFRPIWTDELTTAAQRRRDELEAQGD
jgi:hypothetical protein